MSQQPIIKEVIINAPISKVWKAITDKDQMREWYFDLAEFKPRVGFKFQFEGGTAPKATRILQKRISKWAGTKLSANHWLTFLKTSNLLKLC